MSAWQTEYPTVAMVNGAAFSTLKAWDENLPSPQNDVERTVRGKIKKQMIVRVGEEVRAKAPSVADQWNRTMDKLEKLAGMTGAPRM